MIGQGALQTMPALGTARTESLTAGGTVRADADLPDRQPMPSFSRVTGLLLLNRLLTYGLAIGNSVVLARTLGTDGLGQFAYATGLAGLFGLLPHLGISTVVTRVVASDPGSTSGVLSTARKIQGGAAATTCALVVLTAWCLPIRAATMTDIVLAAMQMALASLSWPYLAVLAGRARYDLLAGVETGMTTVGSLALFVAAIGSGTVQAFLWSQVLVTILGAILARRVAAGFIESGGRSTHTISAFLRTAVPFGMTAFLQSAYTRCDLVLLSQLVPGSVLGLYSAAYKPITMLTHFGSSAAGALFPYMVDEMRAGTSGTFHRVMKVFAVTAPALALIFSGLATRMLETLYGEAFTDAAPMLTILAWSAAANWLYVPLCTTLQAKHREYAWLRGLSIALVVNMAINLVVIPTWGGTGAALATLVSESLLLVIGAWLVMNELGHRPPARMVVCIGTAAGFGAWTLWQSSEWGPFPSTAGSLTVYAAILRATGIIGWQDGLAILSRIREAVQGKHRS